MYILPSLGYVSFNLIKIVLYISAHAHQARSVVFESERKVNLKKFLDLLGVVAIYNIDFTVNFLFLIFTASKKVGGGGGSVILRFCLICKFQKNYLLQEKVEPPTPDERGE